MKNSKNKKFKQIIIILFNNGKWMEEKIVTKYPKRDDKHYYHTLFFHFFFRSYQNTYMMMVIYLSKRFRKNQHLFCCCWNLIISIDLINNNRYIYMHRVNTRKQSINQRKKIENNILNEWFEIHWNWLQWWQK